LGPPDVLAYPPSPRRFMRRRDFITLLAGGAAAAWPLGARAEQQERIRQIGVLMANVENSVLGKGHLAAFTEELSKLGWTEGRNLRMVIRWTAGDLDRTR